EWPFPAPRASNHGGPLSLGMVPAYCYFFFGSIFNTLAGLPTTTLYGGTSRVTTLPAPTIAYSPTVIPQSKVALEPIEAPFLTREGMHFQSASVCKRPSASVARGIRSLMKVTLCPMNTSSSNVTPSQMKLWLEILHRFPIFAPFWISTNVPIFTSSPISQPYKLVNP